MNSDEVLALARVDLGCYGHAVYPGFAMANHLQIVIDALEAVERGSIKRLMIFMPPRHGKSLTCTQLFPSWFLGRNPACAAVVAIYGQELSDSFGRRVRAFVSDPRHQAIFPECQLSPDSAAAGRFDLKAGGSYYAVGRGGALTGRGANLLVLDDLLKDFAEASSSTIRAGLHDWFDSVAFPRLEPDGAILYVGTRWHSDDLGGRLLREQPGEWTIISLEAIAAVDETFRKAGEALWPERYPLPVLEEIKKSIGSAAWTSLYQQRPVAAGGGVFKREWFQTYRDVPPSFKKTIQSWDTAFKKGVENDYSVCTTWGVTQTGYYLLHAWRARVEFPELTRMVAVLAEEWRPQQILIEDKSSGQSLIQALRNSTRFPVLPVKVDTDKRARAEACTGMIEAGRVFLPESAPWLNDYVDEFASFPSGLHDDQVDSTTQALNHLRERRGNYMTVAQVVFGGGDSGYRFIWDK